MVKSEKTKIKIKKLKTTTYAKSKEKYRPQEEIREEPIIRQ